MDFPDIIPPPAETFLTFMTYERRVEKKRRKKSHWPET